MSETQKEIATPADKTQDSSKKKFFTTKKITTLAVLAALCVIVKIIGNTLTFTSTFRVSFIYVPWLLAAIITGPIGGCIVSGLSDVLTSLMLGESIIPLTFVSNLIYPLFTGLAFKFLPVKNDYVKAVIGAVISLVVCTLGIGSYSLYTFYGYNADYDFFSYLLAYRTPQIFVFVINLVLLCLLINPLKSVKIIPETEKNALLKAGPVFIVSEILLAGMFATGLIFLIQGESSTTAYITIISVYVLLALYISLLNVKNITGTGRAALTLQTLAFLAAIAAIVQSTNTKVPISIIPLFATLAVLLTAAAVFLIVRKKKSGR